MNKCDFKDKSSVNYKKAVNFASEAVKCPQVELGTDSEHEIILKALQKLDLTSDYEYYKKISKYVSPEEKATKKKSPFKRNSNKSERNTPKKRAKSRY